MSEESPFEEVVRKLLLKVGELVEVQRWTAESLAELLEVRKQEATGELKPHWQKAKKPQVWMQCRQEALRLLDEHPFLDWDRARQNEVFRDKELGNIYRPAQWRRFLEQHAIPNKPEDGDVVLVPLGKADKDGPPAVARRDSLHCAKKAFENPDSWEWNPYKKKPEECGICRQKALDREQEAINREMLERLL